LNYRVDGRFVKRLERFYWISYGFLSHFAIIQKKAGAIAGASS